VRAKRVLLFLAAGAVAACGGFLGFGSDDGDDGAPGASPGTDSATGDGGAIFADGAGEPLDGASFSDVSLPPGDAAVDVVDQTPVDAGQGALVHATFDTQVVGGDGADVAAHMAWTKAGAIDGGGSAITETLRPASLTWGFPAQASVTVLFSVRILTLPKGAAGLMRLTGTGQDVTLLVGSGGEFALRSNGVVSLSDKMAANVTYRVGVSINANGNGLALAGFTTTGSPQPSESVPWVAGTMNVLEIITEDSDFSYVIDDVFVTTKTP
jgi:hypothetical protein